MSQPYRMTVRLPDPAKEHVERAAALDGLSVAAWVARVAGQAATRRLADHARDTAPDPGLADWWALTTPAGEAVRTATASEQENS